MASTCPVYVTADFIGKRWTLLILLELSREKQALRYSELKVRLAGISPKMLSCRLKELEQRGLVNNVVDASQVPIRSEYGLTRKGREFVPIIRSLRKWALEWEQGTQCDYTSCEQCPRLNA